MNLSAGKMNATTMVLPKRLYPDKGQPLAVLSMSLLMTCLALWLLPHARNFIDYALGGFLLLLFLPVGFVSAYALVPGRMYMELTSQGLTMQGLGKPFTISWRDVERFGVYKANRSEMLGLRFLEGRAPQGAFIRRMSAYGRAQTGYDGSLGTYRYGMSRQELADLLNGLKDRFTNAAFR